MSLSDAWDDDRWLKFHLFHPYLNMAETRQARYEGHLVQMDQTGFMIIFKKDWESAWRQAGQNVEQGKTIEYSSLNNWYGNAHVRFEENKNKKEGVDKETTYRCASCGEGRVFSDVSYAQRMKHGPKSCHGCISIHHSFIFELKGGRITGPAFLGSHLSKLPEWEHEPLSKMIQWTDNWVPILTGETLWRSTLEAWMHEDRLKFLKHLDRPAHEFWGK